MKKSRFTEEQIIGRLKQSRSRSCAGKAASATPVPGREPQTLLAALQPGAVGSAQAQEGAAHGQRALSRTAATRVNEMWRMDFVSDILANCRRIKCLTIADDFTHECMNIAVDQGISAQYATRLLDRAAIFKG